MVTLAIFTYFIN